MINVALVGAAHIHTPGFIKRIKERGEAVKVKAVWDHDAARAAKAAADLNSQAVQDAAAIWKDKEIQAVVICSETNRHQELVLAAAKAKKHMFVEKPLGMGSKDAFAMAQGDREGRRAVPDRLLHAGQPGAPVRARADRQGQLRQDHAGAALATATPGR